MKPTNLITHLQYLPLNTRKIIGCSVLKYCLEIISEVGKYNMRQKKEYNSKVFRKVIEIEEFGLILKNLYIYLRYQFQFNMFYGMTCTYIEQSNGYPRWNNCCIFGC